MRILPLLAILAVTLLAPQAAMAKPSTPLGAKKSPVPEEHIYQPGKLTPRASVPVVDEGDKAPDFTLPSVGGDPVTLSSYRGKNYVVLSFVPAAFTPVCSDQWPGYNLGQNELLKRDAVVVGITVDNIPALFAWTQSMGGCWFPVLSDFFPHGAVAERYGVLRPEGVTERALFIIDKKGTVRHAEVHDINELPRLKNLLDKLDEIRAEDGE